MATATGDTTQVQIFDPVLYIGDTDQGYIGESAVFAATFEVRQFRAGIPKTLRKNLKIQEDATLRLEQMEITPENLKRALSLDTSIISNSIVTAGGDSTIPEIDDVVLEGIDDASKKIHIRIFKAQVIEVGEMTFDDDFLKIPITFAAISDLTKPSGRQLFEIAREI
jgi:hypothetical protein